jgi:uncharacterized membrane protein
MKRYLLAYLAMLVAFCAMDYVWLGFITTDFYKEKLGALLLAEPKMIAAALFYPLYVAGILVFAVAPASSWRRAAVLGGFFGIVAYATYDLSNWATLKGWPGVVVIADVLWGMVITGVAATVGKLVAGKSST